MIYEVAAAVDHILSLISETPRPTPIPPSSFAPFASTLKDALEKRCQKCWKSTEPECGSAGRSVAWQLHPGGEGADADLLRAFASVVEAQAEEGEIVHPHQSKVVGLALEWLPMAFTLWIDPGCVAVRRGGGPGASRSSCDFDSFKTGASSHGSVHVIWGQMVANAATESGVPQLTVSSVAPRPIPIVKPTEYHLGNGRPALHHRNSSTSSSSASSSSSTGLVRSVSLSSTHTVSTDATSLNELDAESEACPSLCSPSTSSVQCTPISECESIHDTTIGGADTTQRFAGVRLFSGDDQDDQDVGDVTIGVAPTTLGLSVSKDTLGAPAKISIPTKPNTPTPVKCNYTTHDNGNVGVLGGGVRLGGAKPTTSAAPKHRNHSVSKSISHLQGVHGGLMPAFMPRQQQQQQMQYNGANYSAPMHTVPLPAVGQGYYGYPPQQFCAPQPQRPAPMMAYPHQQPQTPLPTPFGFPQQPSFAPTRYAPQQATNHDLTSETIQDDGAEKDGSGRNRRLRSRGRRSRGRGAGRAARRQAAALRALELGSTEEFEEEDEDLISRCSTPATGSEYTYGSSGVSSCYTSAASSPVKQVSAKGSRGDLRREEMEFGLQLSSGLARLQLA